MHDPYESPLEGSRDMFMHKESPSLGFDDSVISNPLDHSHVSPMWSLPSPSPKYYLDEPINNFLRFVILILIWAMSKTYLICLVGMLIILCPEVTFEGVIPPLILTV